MRIIIIYFLLLVAPGLALFLPLPIPLRCMASIVALLVGASFFLLAAFFRVRTFLPADSFEERLSALSAVVGWMLGLNRESYIIEDDSCKKTLPSGFFVNFLQGIFSGNSNTDSPDNSPVDYIPYFPDTISHSHPHDRDQLPRPAGPGLMPDVLTGLPGVILIDRHSAVLTKKGMRYARELGAGVNYSEAWEYISLEGDGTAKEKIPEIVDLRRQFRFTYEPNILTRDGLYCRAGFFSIFEIDRDPDPKAKRYYRFKDGAVRKAVESQYLGAKESEWFDWAFLPNRYGLDCLLNIIATHNLDELYAPRDDSSPSAYELRGKINQNITESIRPKLKEHGINLIFAGVATISPATAGITDQRIESWKAAWQKEAEIEKSKVKARRIEKIGKIRAQAEQRIIVSIQEEVSKLTEEYRTSVEALRLAAAIGEMATRVVRESEDEVGSPENS